jgi:hypothetical protein
MLKTFLTEYRTVGDFERCAGENIQAYSWEEAEKIAETLWVEVIGELVETIFVNEGDYNFGY